MFIGYRDHVTTDGLTDDYVVVESKLMFKHVLVRLYRASMVQCILKGTYCTVLYKNRSCSETRFPFFIELERIKDGKIPNDSKQVPFSNDSRCSISPHAIIITVTKQYFSTAAHNTFVLADSWLMLYQRGNLLYYCYSSR